MSGQTGVVLDKADYKYAGTVVPIHDTSYGLEWRGLEASRADGFDALVDDARESERTLMRTIDDYMWDGNSKLESKRSRLAWH